MELDQIFKRIAAEFKLILDIQVTAEEIRTFYTLDKHTGKAILDLSMWEIDNIPSQVHDIPDLESLILHNVPDNIEEFQQIKNFRIRPLKRLDFPKLKGLYNLNLQDTMKLYLDMSQKIRIRAQSHPPLDLSRISFAEFLDLSGSNLNKRGVSFAGLSEVKHLKMDNCHLLSIDQSIGEMSNLRSLRANNNSITNLPSELEHLKQLTSLELSNNQISVLPLVIPKLVQLTHLDLSQNQLNALPEEIFNLIYIEYVDLSKNQLFEYRKEKPVQVSNSVISDHSISSYSREIDITTRWIMQLRREQKHVMF